MNTPNMISEVIESVDFMFADVPEASVDCLLFLKELKNRPDMVEALSRRAEGELANRSRCTKCGERLQFQPYYEVHTEIDNSPVETMYEPYCPNCDIITGEDYE